MDNYLIHNSFVDRRRANGTLRAIKALLTGKLKDKTDFVKKAKMHLCQSYYAIHYLETIGISGKQVRYLSALGDRGTARQSSDGYFICGGRSDDKTSVKRLNLYEKKEKS